MSSDPQPRFDVVIVGAGLAGSTAGILLARAGWTVALIERQRFPRRKVCGECIAASNLPLLHALGVGDAFDALAGAPLRRVTLLRGTSQVTADLPMADNERFPWGRALGRETLDGLLLEQARAAGATVFQPWALRAVTGEAGAWQCELRAVDSPEVLSLRANVVIDAHGSWEDLPSQRPQRRLTRSAADLFAFKANFMRSALAEGAISVLALDGGYGGMVFADGDTATIACCIRRDRLATLRAAMPGMRAGDAVQSWLQRECAGVRRALQGAERDGPWLTSGPLAPGVRLAADDLIFRVGNAAGEAHPILGEGMSMAMQSAALLCTHLVACAGTPDAERQARVQRAYAADWRQAFEPRLRLAALFAHTAMRPHGAAAMMLLTRLWPGLLTHGARWGGKLHLASPIVDSVVSPIDRQANKTRYGWLNSRTARPAPRTLRPSSAGGTERRTLWAANDEPLR